MGWSGHSHKFRIDEEGMIPHLETAMKISAEMPDNFSRSSDILKEKKKDN